LIDFDIQRCTRRCAATDRDLRPGETIYSVLVRSGAAVERVDFSEEGWSEPPADALSWWKTRLPDPAVQRMQWAPNDVMLQYFEQLEAVEDQRDTRYVLALLLVRRKVLRLEEPETVGASGHEPAPAGDTAEPTGPETGKPDQIVVYCPRNETTYYVDEAPPTPDRVEQIQQELAQLLMMGNQAALAESAEAAEPAEPADRRD